jgi:hypothetical protein
MRNAGKLVRGFPPAGRTAEPSSHPLGQALIVTGGCGWGVALDQPLSDNKR